MRAVNEGAAEEALRLIDESHARLLDDRRTLQAVESALRELEPTTVSEPGGRFIGPLAGKLGIRPATLRKWERAALVRPCRDPRTAYRVYDEADVRDARLAHQLRRGGYLLEQIAPLIAQVRAAGGLEPLEAALRDWRGRLSARGRADAGRGCRVGGVPPRARMSLRPPARSGTPRADTSFGARDTFLTGTP
jgi:DNA-binding transcriptional MerR regulator